MRIFTSTWAGALVLLAPSAFAGTPPFNSILKLPAYSAPNIRSAEAAVPAYEEPHHRPNPLNRLTVQAQERQCRQNKQYAFQARAASNTEIQMLERMQPQSPWNTPGFGHVAFCAWYPHWRWQRLFGSGGDGSFVWPDPRGNSPRPQP